MTLSLRMPFFRLRIVPLHSRVVNENFQWHRRGLPTTARLGHDRRGGDRWGSRAPLHRPRDGARTGGIAGVERVAVALVAHAEDDDGKDDARQRRGLGSGVHEKSVYVLKESEDEKLKSLTISDMISRPREPKLSAIT